MTTSRFLGTGLGVLLALAGPAMGQTSTSRSGTAASGFVWGQELTGSLGGRTAGGGSGQGRIRPDRAASLGVAANLGVWELGAARIDQSAVFDVSASFTYDQVGFTAGDQGRLDHQVTAIDLFRRWTLVRSDSNRLVAGIGVKVLDVHSRASNQTTLAQGTVDSTIPLPMLSLAARVGSDRGLAGFGSVRWFGATVADAEAELLEFSLGADQALGRHLHAALGYRSLGLDLDYRKGRSDASRLDLDHAGPFLEVGARF